MRLWVSTATEYEGDQNAFRGVASFLWWKTKVRITTACPIRAITRAAGRWTFMSVWNLLKAHTGRNDCSHWNLVHLTKSVASLSFPRKNFLVENEKKHYRKQWEWLVMIKAGDKLRSWSAKKWPLSAFEERVNKYGEIYNNRAFMDLQMLDGPH